MNYNFSIQPSSYNEYAPTSKKWLIAFYKSQYLEFKRIGIGGRTRFDVEVTEKLIRCTERRLDQITKGEKTHQNMCYTERLIKIHEKHHGGQKALPSSNRSFIGSVTPTFHLKDLEPTQEQMVYNNMDAEGSPYEEPMYIDKYTTAYNSEIMVATLSHDN